MPSRISPRRILEPQFPQSAAMRPAAPPIMPTGGANYFRPWSGSFEDSLEAQRRTEAALQPNLRRQEEAEIAGVEAETASRRHAISPVNIPGMGQVDPRAVNVVNTQEAGRLRGLEPYTLSEGQVRYGPGGREIARGLSPEPPPQVPGVHIPFSPDVEAQKKRLDGAPQDDTALAGMVISNPSLLAQLPPTSRASVLRAIASGSGQLANQRQNAVNSIVDGALETIRTLKEHGGFEGAVGFKGPVGTFTGPLAGTPEQSYASYVDTLKAKLTLPQLEFLRGLGHMSDREFKAISDSVTALNRDMPEGDFLKELGNIEANLGGMRGRAATGGVPQGGPSAPQGSGQFSFTATNPSTGQKIGSNDGVNWQPIQ